MMIINPYVYAGFGPLWDAHSVNGSVSDITRKARFASIGATLNQFAATFTKSSGKWLFPFVVTDKSGISTNTLVTVYWKNEAGQSYGMYLTLRPDGGVDIGRKYFGGTQYLSTISSVDFTPTSKFYVGVDIDVGEMFIRRPTAGGGYADHPIPVGPGFAGSSGFFSIDDGKKDFEIQVLTENYNGYNYV